MKTKIRQLKKLFTVFSLVFIANCTLAQTGNNYWTLPPQQLQITPTLTLTALPTNTYNIGGLNTAYTGGNATEQDGSVLHGPHNMFTDQNGNPLFSVLSGYIFNSHGYLVDTLMDTITLQASLGVKTNYRLVIPGFTEACIVPNPANCKQYYVFTALPISVGSGNTINPFYVNGTGPVYDYNACQTPQQYNIVKPYFTLLDMAQSGPYMPGSELGKNLASSVSAIGKATAADLYKATSTPNLPGGCKPAKCDIHYATTKVINQNGATPYRLLFVMNNEEIITYKVTGVGSPGVQWVSTNMLSSITSSPTLGNLSSFVNPTELEVYQDYANNKIKVAFSAPTNGGFSYNNNPLVLMNFDTLGNYVTGSVRTLYTNSINTQALYCKGIEFSPDGNYVFVAHNYTTNYPSTVDRITYSTAATSYTLSTNTSFQDSQIEKGKDGNLYLVGTTTATPSMAKISSPNAATPVFTANVLNLSSYNEYYLNGDANGTSIYNLPDQIDQEIYGSNFNTSNLTCCLFYNTYDKQTYTGGNTTTTWTNTATTQTWTPNTSTATANNPLALQTNLTNTVTIGELLRIPAGYVITISNMTLKFSPQARLIIENGTSTANGGKLILNNCTLTVDNRCKNDMWPGIQVWGSPGLAQSITYQGWLYAYNNTVIQNAYVGVLAGCDTTSWLSALAPAPPITINSQLHHLPFGTAVSGRYGGGGIVQCVDATFLNNQRHAVYYDYASGANAAQKLQNVTFKSTNLLGSVKQRYFVGMYGHVGNFFITGCTFVDTTNNSYSDTGLYTINSAYYIDQGTKRSTFNNFLYGVYSNNTSGSATISCKNSTFTSNKVGIYLGYINNAIVENDTVKIFASLGGGNCTGLYLDNCSGYYVQDNNFTKGPGSTANNKYGILVNNSGAAANAIFRNSFDNIYKGSQAQYRNYVATAQSRNGTGLLYLCNKFASGTISGADIYVPQTGSVNNINACAGCDTAGIGNLQGNNSPTGGNRYTADNQFSHTTGGQDFYIENGKAFASSYEYYASAGNCGVASTWLPSTYNRIALTCTTLVSAPDCSTGGTGHRTIYVNPISQAINDAAMYKKQYDSLNLLIDGGSTNGLLNLINGNNNSQAVYNSLHAATPYLSNTVLKGYINSHYPSTDIKQILTECSPLSDDVNNELQNSSLTSDVKNQISLLQTGQSKIDELLNNISSTFTARQFSFDNAIRILVRIDNKDTVAITNQIMKEKTMDLPAREQLQTGIAIHDSAFAAKALAQVIKEEGQNNYVKLHTVLLQNLSKTSAQIMSNPNNVSMMLNFDKDSTDRTTYLKANTLLSIVGKSNYVPYIQPEDTTSNGANVRKHKVQDVITPITSESSLTSQPNPFTESTIVKAVIVEKTQNAYIVITDMVGNEIARYTVQQGENNINVNAGNLNQAIMFCTLVVDGVKIKTNKMVLIK